MSNHKLKIQEEMKTLKDLESELEELLSTVKPSEKLKKWNEFTVEKDIYILWKKESIIEEGTIVVIVDKIKGEEWKTDTIKYTFKWKVNWIRQMSKWIFIVTFCKDITSKEEELSKKIKKLRNRIKEEGDKIDNKNILKESNKVQGKVHFLLRIAKRFSKKI